MERPEYVQTVTNSLQAVETEGKELKMFQLQQEKIMFMLRLTDSTSQMYKEKNERNWRKPTEGNSC